MYEQLIEIVKQAGAMIREAHEAEIPVYDKEGIANFVTKYDKDCLLYTSDAADE